MSESEGWTAVYAQIERLQLEDDDAPLCEICSKPVPLADWPSGDAPMCRQCEEDLDAAEAPVADEETPQ